MLYNRRVKKKPSSRKLADVIQTSLFIEKFPAYFLIAALIGASVAMLYVLSPFLTVIFVAAVLSITFRPLYLFVLKKMPNLPRVASMISCFLVVLITIVPLFFFSVMIANEGGDAYITVRNNLESGAFDKYLLWEPGGVIYDFAADSTKFVGSYVDIDSLDLKEKIIGSAQDLSRFLAGQLTYLFTGVFDLLLKFLFMIFALYYFFKDGPKILEKLRLFSPLPANYEDEVFTKVKSMVNAIMLGVFVTAIGQGLVGGIGFTLAGISSPAFWGTAMALFSLVPVVGTTLIWIPAVIVLLILGAYGKALFLAIWGVFVIGMVDNILRPYLIGGRAHTYPLLTFFVILGGIFVMGFKGVIVGPLVLMLLMSILHIYEVEYKQVLNR